MWIIFYELLKLLCNYMYNYICSPLGGFGNQLFVIINTMLKAYNDNSIFTITTKRCSLEDMSNNKRLDERDIILKTLLKKLQEGKNYLYCKNVDNIINIKLSEVDYMQTLPEKELLYKLLKDTGIFEFRDEMKMKYHYLIKEGITVSLHIRHADYRPLGWILNNNYYFKCIRELKRIIGEDLHIKFLCFFHIIEDSVVHLINKLKDEFSGDDFLSIDVNIPPEEALMIQSMCNHNIVPNSTFSLWGSILNTDENSMIFYPSCAKALISECYIKKVKSCLISIPNN